MSGVARSYGCEEDINGIKSMVLTLASHRGKGGHGKKQDNDIEVAATRFGSWYDGK